MKLLPPALVFSLIFTLTGCQTIEFYRQAIGGQIEILTKSRPTEKVLADPAVAEKVKVKLREVEQIREFASTSLSLPGDESYGKYADLGREYVSWVLYAAPEFSLKPKTWWYPTLGELDYRGYFRAEDSNQLAEKLRAEGYDVCVGGVDAYSTLGWFHDPVLNTFVAYSDVDLAELIFHELTHRKLFRNGDTDFNESLANAVSEIGVQRWLAANHRDADLKKYRERLVKRQEFYAQIEIARGALEKLYASGIPPEQMRERKKAILADLQQAFRDLRKRWGGRGLEGWLKEDINNAHLVSLITYQEHVPAFKQLLEECGGDLDVFFKKAKDLKFSEP
ncbi:aminopeptidase [Luteolibacter pohnpeiensis]|uniref:Aminopeptidase n=1 Tax=Luteolibacter pohnpeiensis TaxID=454153 RepID=A0A934VW49_9BACT|nr:aminopeptidase [Luteolibacter pohnpeiensis]MBK1884257.1 aminopeptidase [Luteolibacter pohnpeiensis]